MIFNILIFLFVLSATTGLYASLANKELPRLTYQDLMNQEDTLLNHNGLDDGLECFQCHITIGSHSPEKKVSSEQCLACHSQSYNNLIIETQNLDPNPHDSPHYDDLDCTICHGVHSKSNLTCAECHTFDWMNDLGSDWIK